MFFSQSVAYIFMVLEEPFEEQNFIVVKGNLLFFST